MNVAVTMVLYLDKCPEWATEIMLVYGQIVIFPVIIFDIFNNPVCYLLPILPHSAPSWVLSLAENPASFCLQDGATEWYYNH